MCVVFGYEVHSLRKSPNVKSIGVGQIDVMVALVEQLLSTFTVSFE